MKAGQIKLHWCRTCVPAPLPPHCLTAAPLPGDCAFFRCSCTRPHWSAPPFEPATTASFLKATMARSEQSAPLQAQFMLNGSAGALVVSGGRTQRGPRALTSARAQGASGSISFTTRPAAGPSKRILAIRPAPGARGGPGLPLATLSIASLSLSKPKGKEAPAKKKRTPKEVFDQACKSALRGGLPGMAAMGIQVRRARALRCAPAGASWWRATALVAAAAASRQGERRTRCPSAARGPCSGALRRQPAPTERCSSALRIRSLPLRCSPLTPPPRCCRSCGCAPPSTTSTATAAA